MLTVNKNKNLNVMFKQNQKLSRKSGTEIFETTRRWENEIISQNTRKLENKKMR